LPNKYGVAIGEVANLFCQGYSFSTIDLTLNLSQAHGVSVEEILSMKARGLSWGQIKRAATMILESQRISRKKDNPNKPEKEENQNKPENPSEALNHPGNLKGRINQVEAAPQHQDKDPGPAFLLTLDSTGQIDLTIKTCMSLHFTHPLLPGSYIINSKPKGRIRADRYLSDRFEAGAAAARQAAPISTGRNSPARRSLVWCWQPEPASSTCCPQLVLNPEVDWCIKWFASTWMNISDFHQDIQRVSVNT
jgi:hypothetical protein